MGSDPVLARAGADEEEGLPAEQVASAQSHEVDLTGASGANRRKEHLHHNGRQKYVKHLIHH